MMSKTKSSGIVLIGEIPSTWYVKPLKYCVDINKSVLTESTPSSYEFRYIDIGSVDFSDGITSYEELTFENAPSRARRIVRKGDTIVSTVRTYLKAIAKIEDDDDVIVSTGFAVLSPSQIDDSFLEFFCKSEAFCEEIDKQSSGIAYPAVNTSQVGRVYIPLPPIAEQRAIGTFLNDRCKYVDGIVNDLERQVEILRQYKKALITETVTKGLDKSVLLKDSGIAWIGDMPSHWEIKRLKYCLEEQLQYGANESGDIFEEGLPRYIRITDIDSDNTLKEDGKLSLSFSIAKPYLLQDGDVLFARSGATVGKSFYYDEKYGIAAFAGYLIKARVNRRILLPRYLYFVTLGSGYEIWKDQVFSQATIQNIGADKYSLLLMTIPPIPEQARIAAYLDSKCAEVDTLIAEKQHAAEIMQQYKRALIYEYVTGKKRVIS